VCCGYVLTLRLTVAIILSRFKNNYSTIRCALLDLDSSRLSIDDLRAISKHLPTSEEVSKQWTAVDTVTPDLPSC